MANSSTDTFSCIVTTLGMAKIAAAVANGTVVNISQIAVGDGNGNSITVNPNQAGLVREVYRAGINSLTRDPVNLNYIVAELIIPPEVGGWTVREFGVFDNAGALIAVGQYPDSYKPLPTQGAARDMIIRAIIQITNEATVNLIIDGNLVVASRQWVQDNFGAEALFPGGNTGDVLTKKSNNDGDVEWHDPAEGMNITCDVEEENQILAAGQVAVELAIVTTNSIAVFINGVRLRNDQYAIAGETSLTLNDAPAGGEKITIVQNEPAGADQFLRTFQNLADVPDKPQARQNLGLATVSETVAAVLQALYPVGEVYTTRRVGNPADLLGFGTWERYGKGKFLVGLDPNDAKFNAVDLEGGEAAHVLTPNEMPTHVHHENDVNLVMNPVGDHVHSHLDSVAAPWSETGIGDRSGNDTMTPRGVTDQWRNTNGGGGHTPSGKVPAHDTQAAGSGWAHNNLPPFKVWNVWLRTA